MKSIFTLSWFCFGAAVVACGNAEPPKNVDPKFSEVATIHKAKCGRCHKRVEPGQKTRAYLEQALKPHRKRVPMSEDNWSLMVDYLSADSSQPSVPPG
jgi:hypothetical protein